MKIAISLPDADHEQFEDVAHRHGMNRSEFYRLAARRFADELDGASGLTDLANRALAVAGAPDDVFVRSNESRLADDASEDW